MSSQGGIDFAREQSYPTPLQNSTLLHLLLLSLATQRHTPRTKSEFKDTYDYIVIGAGSGGSVVASRLSEKHCITVLLLEAGKPPPLITEVPAFTESLQTTDIDWKYVTEPQKHSSRLMVNQQVYWPSGMGLGGTSLINGMYYIRGIPEDYDLWESQGAVGWSYKKVLPYFKKAEDNQDMHFVRNGYHGVGGPMPVKIYPTETEFIVPTIKAQKRLGYHLVDPNGAHQIGISDYQGNIRNAQRCSVAKGYLVPAENRTNLDILAEAFVTKIVIRNNTAIGVQFDFQGSSHTVNARKEVILSAGAVNSAQLLILSGVGPRKTLKKFKIPMVADLPVGKHFQDHSASFLFFSVDSSILPYDRKIQDAKNVMQYINYRTGILASAAGIYGFSFLKDDRNANPEVADFQLYFRETPSSISAEMLGLTTENFDKIYGPYVNGTNVFCLSQILHPRSRGYVSIKSTNPYDQPVIDPNYLEDPQDVRDIAAGLKMCRRIFEQRDFRPLKVKEFKTVYPGCESFVHDEDQYLECVTRSFGHTVSHQVGTAKMGNPAKKCTVVDPELRVKGIERLRVVDASVMPVIPSANTNNPVIMIAEKTSDLIKQQIKC